MGIFDFIQDILYKKSGSLLKKKELEPEFQPFMIQRWLSMYSNATARILNGTTNKIHKCLDEKGQWYKLFLSTVPKNKFKRFRYIKKVSSQHQKKTDLDEAIKLVAQAKKISEREVRQYVEEFGLDLTSIQKSVKKESYDA